MTDTWDLRLGEERPVKLPVLEPPGEWTFGVTGMQSAVRVQRLWASDPYPNKDDVDESGTGPAPSMVFMVRATAPGEATVRFQPTSAASFAEPREIRISVRR